MWICKSCGKENRNDRDHCWNCPTPKDETAVTDERPPSPFRTHGASQPTVQVAETPPMDSQPSKAVRSRGKQSGDIGQTCPNCGDILDSAICYRCSPDYEYLAQPSYPAQPSNRGSFLATLAGMFFIIGCILFAGNVTGLFPTFSYAGFLFMLIAGGLIWLGAMLD